MYTKTSTINSKTNVKTILVTLSCNAKGCKEHTTGANNREAWQASRKLGWITPNAATAFCATHRVDYVVQKGQAVLKSTLPARTTTKSKVAQTKAEKVTAKPAKSSKATKPAKSTKAVAQPASVASMGQSTGKTARSAKLAAKK